MTREFFTPERKRWIAPSTHFGVASRGRLIGDYSFLEFLGPDVAKAMGWQAAAHPPRWAGSDQGGVNFVRKPDRGNCVLMEGLVSRTELLNGQPR